MTDPAQQSPQDVSAGTSTVTTVVDDESQVDVPVMTVKLKKPKTDRKVQWTTETIDNEQMNKKKSKCCCIFKKPTVFGESSSSDSSDEECDHCQGHVDKKKQKHQHDEPEKHDESNGMTVAEAEVAEIIAEAIQGIPDTEADTSEQPAT